MLHEGAPKNCGVAKIQSRSVDRCENPCVPRHARDPVLHFEEQVVLIGSAREKTSRHSAKHFERELPAPLLKQDLLQLWTERTPHASAAWQSD